MNYVGHVSSSALHSGLCGAISQCVRIEAAARVDSLRHPKATGPLRHFFHSTVPVNQRTP